MKNNILKYFFSITLLLGIVSCEDREIVTIENESAPIVMDLSKHDLLLDANFPSNPALTITWSKAGYTVPVETKYEIQISNSETFENPQTLVSTAQSQYVVAFTTLEMNNAAKKVGLVPDVAQKMYFRIKAYLGTNDMEQISNVTILNVTPYLARPTYNFTDLYLVGNAAIGNWDNLATNNTMVPILKTSEAGKYTYTGFFKSGPEIGFKMVKVKGDWGSQFGLGSSAGQLSTDGGSGNITVPAEGYYKLTVDIDALTFAFEALAPPTITYNNISLIGTATGDTDSQLTKSAFDAHLWTAHKVKLNTGVFKFRANNAWDVNWGTNSEYFGVGTAGGADIPVSAEWTYDVYFNDITGNYTLIPTND